MIFSASFWIRSTEQGSSPWAGDWGGSTPSTRTTLTGNKQLRRRPRREVKHLRGAFNLRLAQTACFPRTPNLITYPPAHFFCFFFAHPVCYLRTLFYVQRIPRQNVRSHICCNKTLHGFSSPMYMQPLLCQIVCWWDQTSVRSAKRSKTTAIDSSLVPPSSLIDPLAALVFPLLC